MTVVEFPTDSEGRVYVLVADNGAAANDVSGLSRAGAGDRVVRAAVETWEKALAGMHAAAEGALTQLRRIQPPPDEVELTFGVAVNGKLGATVVTAGSDAHLTVKVVWKNTTEAAG